MTVFLTVPIRLDALHLTAPLSVVNAKADFTRMPYWNGEHEVNPDVANISEDLASYPFENQTLVLPPGVHLHWSLPDALAHGSSKVPAGYEQGMLFPAVPNRWLVTRLQNEKQDKQWVVESDYLHPDKTVFPPADGKTLHSVAIPFPCDRQKGERPFRYLGRIRPQIENDTTPEYLSSKNYRLTVVGYQPNPREMSNTVPPKGGLGEPTFAALYSNCLSVFGLHDAELPTDVSGLRYEVIGWYSDPGQDWLNSEAMSEALEIAHQNLKKAGQTIDEAAVLKHALKDAFNWEIADAQAALPKASIFHAHISMDKKADTFKPDNVSVAMGNTATEALSALLAHDARLHHVKENLEAKLEALHLSERIDHLTLDIGPKFQHARHDRGFSSLTGGTVWGIRITDASAKKNLPLSDTIPAADAIKEPHLLNQLNLAQRELDQAICELDCMQKQLYADWYKYMLCAYPPGDARDDYPDIDEVRFFIEKHQLIPIADKKEQLTQLTANRDKCKKELEDLLHTPKQLQSRPGMRFFRPNEPVLLISGNGLRMTTRHFQSGPHPCGVLTKDLDLSNIDTLSELIGQFKGGTHEDPPGTWHPFSLDWRVEMKPVQEKNNLSAHNRHYDPDFILNTYKLDHDQVELTAIAGKAGTGQAASIYTGSSLLTGHAKLKLSERINAFLSLRLLPKYFEDKAIPPKERSNDFFETHVHAIKEWYDTKKADPKIADTVVDTILEVASVIDDAQFHVLAQALNGFNEALLMHKQTFQLPLDEPLGFEDAKAFTRRVKQAVGSNTWVAPQPLDDFHLIRSGGFKVLDLRLVDTFGRVQDLDVKNWLASELMPAASGESGFFSLPPRLTQAARIFFQWLAGDNGEVEMNSHPATTPVCGWFLQNQLDQSLMVYDASGKAQGALDSDFKWTYAPGAAPVKPEKLPKYLGVMVEELITKAPANFFKQLDTALEHINPARSSEHEALALLIGRPIAVVRAKLKLDLQGHPAINQSWDCFRIDLEKFFESDGKQFERSSDGVSRVKLQIRLGDSRQLNDGLLGYWIEDKDGNYGAYQTGNDTWIERCIADGEVNLTMLLDPRGVVHVTSGILPAEVHEIAPDHYAPALKAMEAWFLTAPILSPADKIALPLPTEADHKWSWIARREASEATHIGPANTQANWDEVLEIQEGWLKLSTSEDKK
ncbi:hypothetical protein [Undibacterium sp. TS12]|uniref:hypothetical protein n=1 Tax=Undibacterium sp. TS12 TaxID=2908202 RepID=UPI001F4C83E8|nr:hypothetical protein [Undibacterium sp. TS12]MCH8619361.1 hypothetical protein [Undibacterium sp. TS12]